MDKPDRNTELIVSTVLLTVIGGAFAVARLWVRYVSSKASGWDDHFIVAALVCALSSRKPIADDIGGECRVSGLEHMHVSEWLREVDGEAEPPAEDRCQ
jgi:hypothetical protein